MTLQDLRSTRHFLHVSLQESYSSIESRGTGSHSGYLVHQGSTPCQQPVQIANDRQIPLGLEHKVVKLLETKAQGAWGWFRLLA